MWNVRIKAFWYTKLFCIYVLIYKSFKLSIIYVAIFSDNCKSNREKKLLGNVQKISKMVKSDNFWSCKVIRAITTYMGSNRKQGQKLFIRTEVKVVLRLENLNIYSFDKIRI